MLHICLTILLDKAIRSFFSKYIYPLLTFKLANPQIYLNIGVLESNHIACLGSADARDLGVLGWWSVHQCGADMGVGGICGEVSAERVTVTIVVVSWVNQRAPGVDADAILFFFGSLVCWLGRGAVATDGHRSP